MLPRSLSNVNSAITLTVTTSARPLRLGKKNEEMKHCYAIQRAKTFASSELFTDTCYLNERCRNTICEASLTRMYAQCAEELKPNGPDFVH